MVQSLKSASSATPLPLKTVRGHLEASVKVTRAPATRSIICPATLAHNHHRGAIIVARAAAMPPAAAQSFQSVMRVAAARPADPSTCSGRSPHTTAGPALAHFSPAAPADLTRPPCRSYPARCSARCSFSPARPRSRRSRRRPRDASTWTRTVSGRRTPATPPRPWSWCLKTARTLRRCRSRRAPTWLQAAGVTTRAWRASAAHPARSRRESERSGTAVVGASSLSSSLTIRRGVMEATTAPGFKKIIPAHHQRLKPAHKFGHFASVCAGRPAPEPRPGAPVRRTSSTSRRALGATRKLRR